MVAAVGDPLLAVVAGMQQRGPIQVEVVDEDEDEGPVVVEVEGEVVAILGSRDVVGDSIILPMPMRALTDHLFQKEGGIKNG